MFIDVRTSWDAILEVGTCLHQRQQMGRVDLPQWTSAANAEIRFFVPAHQILPGAARGRNQPVRSSWASHRDDLIRLASARCPSG